MITDLLDEMKYPAEAMLLTYHSRWGIETVFHQITDVFSLKHLIGSEPKAVLFQLSYCLLLYNGLQVVQRHLASHQKCEAKKISNEKLFDDVKRGAGDGQRAGQSGDVALVAGRGADGG